MVHIGSLCWGSSVCVGVSVCWSKFIEFRVLESKHVKQPGLIWIRGGKTVWTCWIAFCVFFFTASCQSHVHDAGRQCRCYHSGTKNTEEQQSSTNSGISFDWSQYVAAVLFVFSCFLSKVEDWVMLCCKVGPMPKFPLLLDWSVCKVDVAEYRRRQAALAEYARKAWTVESKDAERHHESENSKPLTCLTILTCMWLHLKVKLSKIIRRNFFVTVTSQKAPIPEHLETFQRLFALPAMFSCRNLGNPAKSLTRTYDTNQSGKLECGGLFQPLTESDWTSLHYLHKIICLRNLLVSNIQLLSRPWGGTKSWNFWPIWIPQHRPERYQAAWLLDHVFVCFCQISRHSKAAACSSCGAAALGNFGPSDFKMFWLLCKVFSIGTVFVGVFLDGSLQHTKPKVGKTRPSYCGPFTIRWWASGLFIEAVRQGSCRFTWALGSFSRQKCWQWLLQSFKDVHFLDTVRRVMMCDNLSQV